VRNLFCLDLLHFFAEHPGWYVESDGNHLALWHKGIVRGTERRRFLAEALEVRNALTETRPPVGSAVVSPGQAHTDLPKVLARMPARRVGALAGFLVAGLGSMVYSMTGRRLEPRFGFDLIFFGIPFCGLVLGGIVGNLFLPGPLIRALRRRQTRERQAIL